LPQRQFSRTNTKQTDSHSKLMEIHMEAAMTSFFNKIQSQQKKMLQHLLPQIQPTASELFNLFAQPQAILISRKCTQIGLYIV
jgi:hypothetical protein